MGLPQLMFHSMNVWRATNSKDASGAPVRQIAQVTPDLACFLQEDTSQLDPSMMQRREQRAGKVFLLSRSAWQSIRPDDVLVCSDDSSIVWRVVGRNPQTNLGRLYSVDVEEDLTEPVLSYQPLGGVDMSGSATVTETP